MVENKSSIFGIIAIIVGASGLGLGAFSVVNFQTVEGPQGLPGEDGTDGQDAPGGFIVRILDPDHGEVVSGNITIRTLIYGTENYSLSILRNGTEIGTSLPMVWNTSTVSDGWWNITVKVIDISSMDVTQDDVNIYVENIIRSKIRGYTPNDPPNQHVDVDTATLIDFQYLNYDTNSDFNLSTDRFIAPRDGYYYIHVNVRIGSLMGAQVRLWINVQGTVQGFYYCTPTDDRTSIATTDTVWVNEGEYVYFIIRSTDTGGFDFYDCYFIIRELY